MNLINIKHFPSNKHFQLTKEGLDELKAKLDHLRKERFKVCNHLKKLDPKEKLDHIFSTDAVKMLEMNDDQVTKISDILQHADTVPENTVHEDITLGSTVDLMHGDETVKYMLVDPIEADPFSNKISKESPLGRALLGKKRRDLIKFITPKGIEQLYKVLTVM